MSNLIHLPNPARIERDGKRAFQADLGVSMRAFNLLWSRGVRNIDDLTALSWGDVAVMRGVGWKLQREIEDARAERGLGFSRGGEVVEARVPTDEEKAQFLDVLGFDPATITALNTYGVHLIGDLLKLRSGSLLAMPGVGPTMHHEVRYVLASHGLALAPYVRRAGPPAAVRGDASTTRESLGELPFLSVRSHNRLQWHGVKTAGDIAMMSADELVAIEGFGRMCLVEVRSLMAWMGMALRGEKVKPPGRRP
jgi:DNA-directed RNA polymerase alpha subunit